MSGYYLIYYYIIWWYLAIIGCILYFVASWPRKNGTLLYTVWWIVEILQHTLKSKTITPINKDKWLLSNSAPCYKNIERHTADTIVSWPNPKQWVIVYTSDLMMIIRQSIYVLSIITREMDKLKTYNPTYCIMDNGENMLNLTHTLDKIYLTGIL